MRDIVHRLHENRQVELAKSILESSGYKVTKKLSDPAEEHPGWEYWEMPKGYRGPSTFKHYQKSYKEDTYNDFWLTIYPPQYTLGEVSRYWSAEIVYDEENILEQQDRFKSFEEAEAWINDWLSENGYAVNESRKVRGKRLKSV